MAVVLFVLFMTLGKMFPLNRPEIFFITTKPINSSSIQITELPANDENVEEYKKAFVMEYVRARNEVERNITVMRRKWVDEGSVVEMWSTPEVYATFKKTDMYNAIESDYPDFVFSCPVTFMGEPLMLKEDTYTIMMRYHCESNSGPTDRRDYKIRVVLAKDNDTIIDWVERLNNPLGLKVKEYTVLNGNDPLNWISK
jgi:type IV secretory pathway component VirB8